MTKITRCTAAFLLALGLTAPLVMADDHDTRRYYDKQHKDYHQWNDNEQKSYSVYLNENHITVHTFHRAKPTEQQQYWKWRHDHPDEKR